MELQCLFLWLVVSLGIMSLGTIHFEQMSECPSFSMLNNIPLCGLTHLCEPTHRCVVAGVAAPSTFWQQCLVLL